MPRWLWIMLGSLLLLFAWQSLRSPDAPQFAAANAAGASDCPLPEKFRNADEPLQSGVGNRIQPIHLNGSTLIPLAGFSLQARVLAREDYRLGTEAEFSPTDLALGWGSMAEPGMADRLNVSQSGRFYHYSWGDEGPPIPQNEIISHSANMHIVPGNRAINDALGQISADDVIELHGWLIRIEKNDGWRWQSSLTRDDSGDGACEVVYVCKISIRH